MPPFNGQTQAIIQKKVVEQADDPPEILAEYLPKNRIKVSATLEKPHRLVASLKNNLSDSYQYPGMMTASRHELDIRIGKGSVKRALRIMDALVKALEKRNMQVIIEPEGACQTQVRYLGKTVQINLYEKTKIKMKERDQYGYEGRDFIPTGELVLQLERRCYGPQCKDGKNKKLENSLNDFVIKIYRDVFRQKAWDIEREQNYKKEVERYRLVEEENKKKELERQRIQDLERDVLNWQKSHIIRLYVEASKKAHGEIKPGSEFEQWVNWASQYADQLNPLKLCPAPDNVQGRICPALMPWTEITSCTERN